MNRRILTALFVMVSAFPLSACQSLFGGSRHASKDAGEVSTRDTHAYSAIQLATGRKALDKGQYAEAISAFRVARAEPGLAPDAYNGLAVAYAKLGRADLAARYFNEAIALAPGEDRFKANLARLYKTSIVPVDGDAVTTAIAQAEQQAVALAPGTPSASPTLASTGLKGHVSVSRPTAEIVRVSAREVRIGTPASAGVTRMGQRGRSAVRIERPGKDQANAYPVRVSFGSAPKPSAKAYPIRISLTSAR